ncbi:MAG: aldehyde dehydrogenase family protein [Bacteriovoracaceae bacterium]|nr:aldehyde dehydrogenase family protein [Bacteriovoracaceae bacterium]
MKVVKTIKLYIDGKFTRTESGRSYSMNVTGKETQFARLCLASRKDFRNAVESSKKGFKAWSSKTAFNRSQILYRMAEMTEGKRYEFETLFTESLGKSSSEATKMVDEAIDTFVYYAGFCDKYHQVAGSINPVSGPFHNFTHIEGVGVTTLIEDDEFNFAKLVDSICSIMTGGNSVIVLLGSGCPAVLGPLAEVMATSDVPGGVINILSGHLDELRNFIAEHREVRSISFQSERSDVFHDMKLKATDNMKRMIPLHKNQKSLENILSFIEYKTVWHPVGY